MRTHTGMPCTHNVVGSTSFFFLYIEYIQNVRTLLCVFFFSNAIQIFYYVNFMSSTNSMIPSVGVFI